MAKDPEQHLESLLDLSPTEHMVEALSAEMTNDARVGRVVLTIDDKVIHTVEIRIPEKKE